MSYQPVDPESAVSKTFTLDDIGKVTRTYHILVNRPFEYISKTKSKFDEKLGSEFEKLPHKIGGFAQQHCMVVIRGLVLVLAIMLLPYVYGHLILKYPCRWRDEILDGVGSASGTDHVKLQLDPEKCVLQDFLRSPQSLLLGPALVVVLAVCFAIGTAYMAIMGSCHGPTKLNQAAFHYYLRARLYKMTFTRYPPWVAVMGWMLLILELVAVAVLQRKVTAGLIIAYALGEVYCLIINNAMGASGAYVAVLERELKNLPDLCPEERKHNGSTVWEVFQNNGNTLALTSSQIRLLVSLFPYDEAYAKYDAQTGESWVNRVFCIDTGEDYKLS